MRIIKRLDTFILSAYLQLFAGTFFVCLFIFVMQFTWRHIDDLIGKGIATEALVKLFWYTGLTLTPMSLPLAILLASLITFGNLGEKLELLSMKASGIPLLRILQPIFFFVILVSGASFYFQNKICPEATKQLATLMWSMKQKSPELEIPEGQFYSEIPGYNLYVEQKDKKTGMLYGVMIYTNTGNYEDIQIVLADSAKLQSTADKMHLQLTLYQGERFRNMDAQSGNMLRASIPYMRETFDKEVNLIPFDGNFNLMDASLFAGNAQTKDIQNITRGIDSLTTRIDSSGHAIYATQLNGVMQRHLGKAQKDSLKIVRQMATMESFDTLSHRLSDSQKANAIRKAQDKVKQLVAEYDFRSLVTEEDCKSLRIHYVEWHKKFTLSLACLIFFFIGAPLGAIIRKGGLGIPVITSVCIFIFYYIVNVSGEKMAKTGQWYIPFGVWLSSMVLAPIGAFLTIKANNDSVVFNKDGYVLFFKRLLGLRSRRHIHRKEVVINDPNYPECITRLEQLSENCRNYAASRHLLRIPNYYLLFFRYREDKEIERLNDTLEQLIDELHNSQDNRILALLNEMPVLNPTAHTRPFHSLRANMIAGIVFPIGLFFYFRIWRYRLRLRHDMDIICSLSAQITEKIKRNIHDKQTNL